MDEQREEHLWKVTCESCGVLGWFTTGLEAIRVEQQHVKVNPTDHVTTVRYHGLEPATP